jgi:hypothetical protein
MKNEESVCKVNSLYEKYNQLLIKEKSNDLQRKRKFIEAEEDEMPKSHSQKKQIS